MENWWEILSVYLTSTLVFIKGGVPMALSFGFSFFESVTVTCLGGFTGVIVFSFVSEKIIANYQKIKKKRIENKVVELEKKKFTKTNRIIIRTKRRFGLFGIAFLTPLLFSFPLGCLIAVRYFKDKKRISVYMFSSILFWSVVGYFLYKPIYEAVHYYFL